MNLLLLMFAVGALQSTASAATLAVDPSSSAAYATIQDAIDAASTGDTITVVAGTYTECLDPGGLDLTITGDGSSTTILDGNGGPRAVRLDVCELCHVV